MKAFIQRNYQTNFLNIPLPLFDKLKPYQVTLCGGLLGISVAPLLVFGHSITAFCLLLASGFLDTLDGSLARKQNLASAKGAALDIFCDRCVEMSVFLGLYLVDPEQRALPTVWMLGSVFLCISSFLTVSMLSPKQGEKSFYYSPGIIERVETFIFFSAMILIPGSFQPIAYLFTFLVLLTAAVRMTQFLKHKVV